MTRRGAAGQTMRKVNAGRFAFCAERPRSFFTAAHPEGQKPGQEAEKPF